MGALNPNFELNGLIDEVQVYDRALSDSEIQTLYGVSPTPACSAAPLMACIQAGRASLVVIEKSPGNEKLKAALKKLVHSTTLSDLGDPVNAATRYDLCVYDDIGALAGAILVDRAGDTCGPKQKECWKAKGTRGFAYKDPDAAADGAKKIAATAGPAGKGKLLIAAANKNKKGQSALPSGIAARLANAESAVLQVNTTDGACFGATLGEVKKADGVQFKAKAR